ncbi:SGNH hydrolase [Clathrospora elynae]|uniref:SGNH hydrolase n=1 Tax=Clathrospora elynae TaxID=706981 RepID=A0A6A5S7X0_9PLEO|nr:SGNH hydrolase [Clathrospora elynae]
MPQVPHIALLGLASLLPVALAYPQNTVTNGISSAAEPKFIFGAIGDSWGSGVTWKSSNQFDDNSDSCMRYKYAWSTVVNDAYAQWTPNTSLEPGFEFKACSGSHLGDDMMNQMDQLTRPKLVIMEAGGNDANFYPMADACLFQKDHNKAYGTSYEDDSAENPTGECRKEINLVRGRLQEKNAEGNNNMQNTVEQTIHRWRDHKAVVGNEASLFLLGYARFFGPDFDEACDKWNFNVFWGSGTQHVVSAMRKEFNELVGLMNDAIRMATESFNDVNIDYIDIDPALQGHRFCEPGQSKYDQLNWSNKVYLWNSPGKWFLTVKEGDHIETYDADTDSSPSEDTFNMLIEHPEGEPRQEGDDYILAFRNPSVPDITMEWKITPQGSGNTGGSIARTLHPTQDGHNRIGQIVTQRLSQFYSRSDNPTIILPPNPPAPCPLGCTCGSSGVPLCT